MNRSDKKILNTHVGRLERPEDLTAHMEAHPRGRPANAAWAIACIRRPAGPNSRRLPRARSLPVRCSGIDNAESETWQRFNASTDRDSSLYDRAMPMLEAAPRLAEMAYNCVI